MRRTRSVSRGSSDRADLAVGADDLVAQVILLLAGERAGDLRRAPARRERALEAEVGQHLIAGERQVLEARHVADRRLPDRRHRERQVARDVVAAAAARYLRRRGL